MLFALLSFLLVFSGTVSAEVHTIAGSLRIYRCDYGYCEEMGTTGACVTVDENGYVNHLMVFDGDRNSPTLFYGGVSFLQNGEVVIVTEDTDCKGDGSYQECLRLSVLDSSCNPVKQKTLLLGGSPDKLLISSWGIR